MTIAKAHDVKCPECGAKMVLRSSPRFQYKNGDDRLFYGCSRFPECKGTHGADPTGKPFGVPGDTVTKHARIAAHAAFDELWKPMGARLTRSEAYLWMQSKMGLTAAEAHIGSFTVEQCEALMAHVKDYKP